MFPKPPQKLQVAANMAILAPSWRASGADLVHLACILCPFSHQLCLNTPQHRSWDPEKRPPYLTRPPKWFQDDQKYLIFQASGMDFKHSILNASIFQHLISIYGAHSESSEIVMRGRRQRRQPLYIYIYIYMYVYTHLCWNSCSWRLLLTESNVFRTSNI